MDLPKLDPSIPDAAADMMPHFFSPSEFSALQKIGDLLMPSKEGRPGASDAKAAEFLDFLIGQSPAERQQTYRAGLDGLNLQAQKKYSKHFAELDATQSATLLAPLQQPWTYDQPSDPVARFLRVAKQDLRTATTNSREYATASSRGGAGSRRMAGFGGLYWYPLD